MCRCATIKRADAIRPYGVKPARTRQINGTAPDHAVGDGLPDVPHAGHVHRTSNGTTPDPAVGEGLAPPGNVGIIPTFRGVQEAAPYKREWPCHVRRTSVIIRRIGPIGGSAPYAGRVRFTARCGERTAFA